LIILLGKGGTGKTTTLETLNYQCKAKYGSQSVLNLATTGRAATLIPEGSTLHNAKRGLGIPLATKQYVELKGATLKSRQKSFEGTKLVIIDEFSMLRQSELSYIDRRLKKNHEEQKLDGRMYCSIVW
jgi:ABC-type branched-subunit amino acid transport system ATPase component